MHKVHESLNDGMICGVHVCIEGEITFTRAVESSITIWRNDPILPLKIFEAHVERLNLTAFRIVVARMCQRVPVFCLLLALLVGLALASCVVVLDIFLRFDHLKQIKS